MKLVLTLVALAGCGRPPADAVLRAPVDWHPAIEVAVGGGLKGPWQQNDSRFDYVDDPAVAIAADGATCVAWVDHRDKDVWLQIYERDRRPRLARPTRVSNSPQIFSWLPRLVVDGRDVFVLWQEIVFSGGTHGGEILFARSRDGGVTFGEPVNLSSSRNGDGKGRIDKDRWNNGSLDLARGPDGTLYAAWTEYDGALWFTRSRDRGAQFDPPLHVAGDAARPARAPALAVGERIHLAWSVGEDPAADIQVATSDGVRFGAAVEVAHTAGFSDAPKLALDRAGTLHVAYAESRGGPADRYQIRYARSRDHGRTFEASREISQGLAPSATFPGLAVEGTHVAVVFELHPRPDEPARGLGLAVSRDGGATFSAAPIAGTADPSGGANGSHQGHLMQRLALRGGTIAIGNSSLAHGAGSRVWLVRGELR